MAEGERLRSNHLSQNLATPHASNDRYSDLQAASTGEGQSLTGICSDVTAGAGERRWSRQEGIVQGPPVHHQIGVR